MTDRVLERLDSHYILIGLPIEDATGGKVAGPLGEERLAKDALHSRPAGE
jgi:hypothetical protein